MTRHRLTRAPTPRVRVFRAVIAGGTCVAAACSGSDPDLLFDAATSPSRNDTGGAASSPLAVVPDASGPVSADAEPVGDPPARDASVEAMTRTDRDALVDGTTTTFEARTGEDAAPDRAPQGLLDASSCDDLDPCTVDVGLAGASCAHSPVVCAPSDGCHIAGACDPGSGRCSSPIAPEGTPCTTEQGGRCGAAGVCVPTFLVVRVGDGSRLVVDRSTPVRLERRYLDATGRLVAGPQNPLTLPQAANGSQYPFSLNSTAVGEGALSLSADGRYVTLAGYAAAPGTLDVKTTPNRVVARVDGSGLVDTSTLLTMGLEGMTVRAATSLDGSQFWVAGGTGAAMPGGIHHVRFGQMGGTPIMASPAEIRVVQIFQRQLYAAATTNLLAIGEGTSSMPSQLAELVLPASGNPFAFAILDMDPSVAGPDVAYVADARSPDRGGGIQKWRKSADGQITLVETFGTELGTGLRGLAALKRGNVVALVATTTELAENLLVTLVDDGANRAVSVLANANPNTAFRGVAFAP